MLGVGKTPSRKRPTVEEELAEIGDALRDPASEAHRQRLRDALTHASAIPAARVAATIASRRLGGFEDALRQCFTRFTQNPIKTDPGCRAKLAVLEALDQLELSDPAPFLAGARCVQKEASWGPPIDTAGGVRARAIVALARIGFADFFLVAGELLVDPLSMVRRAAVDALAHHGDRGGAGLAMLKLRSGDDDHQVTMACASALLALAPEWGLRELEPMLLGDDESLRELAAIALGQSGREDGLDLLFAYLDRAVSPDDRAPALRAVGTHRSDRARQFLLDRIAEGSEPEAKAAIESLGARSFEPGLGALVREAARRNDRAELDNIVDQTFSQRPK
jgi:HEAT repeat protein